MRAVVGRVHDERVLGNPELVEVVEQIPHILVMVDHRVVVRRLPAPGLPDAILLGVREHVHVGEVHPGEEGLVVLVLPADEVLRGGSEVIVTGLHPLPGQRSGVFDPLLADSAPPWHLGGIVLVGRP